MKSKYTGKVWKIEFWDHNKGDADGLTLVHGWGLVEEDHKDRFLVLNWDSVTYRDTESHKENCDHHNIMKCAIIAMTPMREGKRQVWKK